MFLIFWVRGFRLYESRGDFLLGFLNPDDGGKAYEMSRITQRHGVILQNTWSLSNTGVTTFNLILIEKLLEDFLSCTKEILS